MNEMLLRQSLLVFSNAISVLTDQQKQEQEQKQELEQEQLVVGFYGTRNYKKKVD